MRQTDRKEATRRRLIDAAGRSFRSSGFTGVGVDAIAKRAGATSGAFYAHLGSKDAAFLVALEAGLDEVLAAIPQYRREHGEKWVVAFADYYLGGAHRRDAECGCAMTALSPDVMRASDEVKELYETKMSEIATSVASGLTGKSQKERLDAAWGYLQSLIGGLLLSRSVSNADQADTIAAAAKRAALSIVSS